MTAVLRSLATVMALALWAALSVNAARAQDSATLDYAAWDRTASHVEAVLEGGTFTVDRLEELRASIVGWRSQFLDAQSLNADRIDTLESQIEALGPVPEDGSPEPDTVAERRSELQNTLAEAQAPVIRATEAFNRADGLIAEIDAEIRERDNEALVDVTPSPLNPANWGEAVTSLTAVATTMIAERRAVMNNAALLAEARGNWPRAALMVLAGLYLMIRGRHWTMRLTQAILRRSWVAGRLALAFLVSLTQVFVPVSGFVLLTGGAITSGLFGETSVALISAMAVVVIAAFAALWLAGRLFPPDPDAPSPLPLPMEVRHQARRLALLTGVFVGLTQVVETVAALPVVDPAAKGVFVLPVYVALAFLFFRFAGLMRRVAEVETEDAEGRALRGRTIGILAQALRIVAVIGPVSAALGYLGVAERIMIPTAMTLGIFGLLLALQVPVRDVYAAITRRSYEDASEALIPVLVSFALALCALPILALTWGVRPERLMEILARINEGFSLGEARVTPGAIFSIALVFGAGILLTRLVQGTLKSTVLPRTKMDMGARNAISAGVGYVGIALAAVLAVTAGGIDLTALGFVLGALSVGIGFGLQNVVSNFVSGIILLIERPISEGDWIEVNGQMGIVKAISVRSTRIETFDKTDVIVPNADFISGTVTNWTRGNVIGRAIVTVGVAYGTDTRRVSDILLEIARGHPTVAAYPEPAVDFLGFGADSLDFRIRMILRDINQLVSVQTEIRHQIAERFTADGIEIPFAQRDVWLRNPEALRPGSSTPVAADDQGADTSEHGAENSDKTDETKPT